MRITIREIKAAGVLIIIGLAVTLVTNGLSEKIFDLLPSTQKIITGILILLGILLLTRFRF